MSGAELTPREREYLECDTPLITGGQATKRLTLGFLTSFAKAIVSPSSGYGKAELKMSRTIREIQYTKYKKAVLRKQNGTPQKKDERLLKKLNKKDFVLAEDTFDADEFTRKLYEEYMEKHGDK